MIVEFHNQISRCWQRIVTIDNCISLMSEISTNHFGYVATINIFILYWYTEEIYDDILTGGTYFFDI